MVTKVLIIAGGTGGHIFPALAVADLLAAQGVEIAWLGSEIGLEKTLVPQRFPLHVIAAKRLRGKGWRAALTAPWNMLASAWQAWRIIRRIKPQAALAMGGFVSGPGGVAAKLAGVRLVVHEQNAIAGYTNRILARFADAVAAAYPGIFANQFQAAVVGNPVRAQITAIPAPAQRLHNRNGPLRILILGGSQGAHALNQLVVKCAADSAWQHQIEFWHQTGKKDYPELQAQYDHLPVTVKVAPFIEDMPAAYHWADLLIARSGALTVAEIAAAGLPSILVPFPYAVDDHQWHNAKYLESAGAAYLVREADLSVDKLTGIIKQFLQDRTLLSKMAQTARDLAQPQAAEAVVKLLLS